MIRQKPNKHTKGAGKAPAPKRRSGPAIPEAERRERGQALLAVRVSADLIEQLDAACERHGLLRPALVRAALEDWLAAESAK